MLHTLVHLAQGSHSDEAVHSSHIASDGCHLHTLLHVGAMASVQGKMKYDKHEPIQVTLPILRRKVIYDNRKAVDQVGELASAP